MKSLIFFVYESLEGSEMENDYEILSGSPNITKKKELAQKYGIESKKSSEIQHAVLLAMRDERKTKKSFDSNDIKWFIRLSGMPSRYKNLCTFLDEESIDFVEYIKSHYENLLKSIKNRGGKTLFDLKYAASGRDWNYVMSSSDKNKVDVYNNVSQYIEEHDPKNVATKNEQENIVAGIKAKLAECMEDFHKEYIAKVENYASNYWDKLPENIKDSEKAYIEAKKKYYDYDHETNDMLNDNKLSIGSSEYKLRKNNTKELDKVKTLASRTYMAFKRVLDNYKSKNDYIKACIDEAEQKYDSNLNNIADRVKEQNFVISDIKVAGVKKDPKFFEMYITDDNKRVHCRSVWAAEMSDKMIPHFRFIVTNKNKK